MFLNLDGNGTLYAQLARALTTSGSAPSLATKSRLATPWKVALCIGAAGQNWLDVDDRRAIDGLDRSDSQPGAGDLAHGHAM